MATSRAGPAATAARMPARPAPTIRMSCTFSSCPIAWPHDYPTTTHLANVPGHAKTKHMDSTPTFPRTDQFVHRHIGPTDADIQEMLATLGLQSLDALVDATVPADIRMRKPLALDRHIGEFDALAKLRVLHDRNQVFRSFIGMGYHDCVTPAVIQRNILENPGWYTQYTPYQAEIAQGRLEALLTFQTMV